MDAITSSEIRRTIGNVSPRSLVITRLFPGVRIRDKVRGRERLVHEVALLGRVVKIWNDYFAK